MGTLEAVADALEGAQTNDLAPVQALEPAAIIVAAPAAELAIVHEGNPVLAYLASLPSENSQRTMRDCIRRVTRTTSYHPDDYENVPWWRVGPEHVGAMRARLLAEHSIATVRVTLAALKGVLEQCFILGRMPADTLERCRMVIRKKIHGGRMKEPTGRMLTDPEVIAIRRACLARGAFAGAMYDALIAVALSGGLRRDELARARVEDVSADCRSLELTGKGRKDARVPLASWAAGSLESWMAQRERFAFKHQHLFVRIYLGKCNALVGPTKWIITNDMKDISAWSGVKFTAHDLRRTFITTMAEANDMYMAQRAARHSDPKTTAIYDRRPYEKHAKAVEESTAKWGKL